MSHPTRPPARPEASRILALLAISLLGAGCGHEERGPIMHVERVACALLARPELREVVRADGAAPPRVGSIMPYGGGARDAGALPSLILPPPCEVRIQLPRSAPGAHLLLAAGLDQSGYREAGEGRVRFEALLEGVPVFEAEIDVQTAIRDRIWIRGRAATEAPAELTLRTEYSGEGEAPQACGFGLLDVIVPESHPRTRASSEAPNVVLICVDTLRADGLSCYGNLRRTSPRLDALAARGTLFERAFAPSPWTWPSTASLFTALSPPEHGLTDIDSCFLAHELETLAEALQRAGVTTAAWSTNPLIGPSKGFAQGFEVFEELPWKRTSQIAREVEPWLREMGEWRFFLYLHPIDPHLPYEPEPDLAAVFAGQGPDGHRTGLAREILEARHAGGEWDPAELQRTLRHDRKLYEGEVAGVDRALGELLDLLRELGLEENTVVAVTSDHGEEFGEHGLTGHAGQLYDELVRVPLILAGPGVPAGVRVERPVENRHVAPTLLELAGVPARSNLRGASLLTGADVAAAPIFFCTRRGRWILPEEKAVRRPPHLYGVQVGDRRLMWAPAAEEGEAELVRLYDLESDPRMRRDIAPEEPGRVGELRARIEAWLEEGERVRPVALDGGEAAIELLRAIGYIGEDQ